MKLFRNKIIAVLLIIWLIILLLRIEFIYEIISYTFGFTKFYPLTELRMDLSDSSSIFQMQILLLLYFLIPFALLLLNKKMKVAGIRFNFSLGVIGLLIFVYIFCPLLSSESPNYQYGISSAKLLPPFSQIEFIIKKNKESVDGEKLRSRDLVYFDKISIAEDYVIIKQRGVSEKIAKSELVIHDDRIIFKKFFLLGSDEFGRDVLTRLLFGSRISLSVGLLSVLISTFLGISLGFIAGYYGGLINTILSRLTDTLVAVPSIFLVLLVLALFGNSFFSVIIVLGFAGWLSLFKIVKGEVISLKKKDYIASAGKLGLSKSELLLREMLPVMSAQVLANVIIQFTNAVLTESTLSYLGLGTGIENPSWGSMIQSGQEYIYSAWWMILIPGVILTLTIFSFNRLANLVRVKLNPRLGK